MTQADEMSKQAMCEALRAAGVAEAQITLALETSGALLEQLARYQTDDRHNRSVREIFDRLAPKGA